MNKQLTPDDRFYLHYTDAGQFEYASNLSGKTVYIPNHSRYDPETNSDAADFLSQGYDLSDRIVPQDPDALQQAIELRLAEITATAKRIQDAVIEQYSMGEVSTWDRKESDARAILSGESAPLLEHEADLSGISALALAAVVVRKADEYRLLSATVAGIRSKHQQVIGQLQGVDEVLAYVADGWPVL